MKPKKKTRSTTAKKPKSTLQAKQLEVKAAIERSKTQLDAKVKAIKKQIGIAGAEAKAEIDKRLAELKGDHRKGQTTTRNTRKKSGHGLSREIEQAPTRGANQNIRRTKQCQI